MKTIPKVLRNQATRALNAAGAHGNTRFPKVGSALSAFFQALSTCGLEAADIVSGDMLLGDAGSRTVSLALTNPQDPCSPTPIERTLLAFSWTRLDRNFEVIAYLT